MHLLYSLRFEKQDGVVLMATTRNLKQVDEALQRPGRMDRIFHLQRPTQAERERILHIAARETMDEDLIDFVDWRKVMKLQYLPLSLSYMCFNYVHISLLFCNFESTLWWSACHLLAFGCFGWSAVILESRNSNSTTLLGI